MENIVEPKAYTPKQLLILYGITYGVLIYLFLPDSIIILDDDFSYIRSVIKTIQHGRPWTDDWLEPWNASFALLSAILFVVSKSFFVATYGLLAILAALTFWSLGYLLLERGVTLRNSVVLSALLMTMPTVLWDTLKYTNMAIYMPCLFLALLAAEKRRWWLFMFVWWVAIASRQSAIAWAAMPALESLRAWWIAKKSDSNPCRIWTAPLLVTFSGIIIFILLMLLMNKTHAQTLITDQILDNVNIISAGETFFLGVFFYIIAAGVGTYVFHWAKMKPMICRWNWAITLFILSLIGLWLTLSGSSPKVYFSHDSFFRHWAPIYLKAIILIATAGWLSKNVSLRIDTVMYALSILVLLSLRGGKIYDRYLVDIAVFGFFGVKTAFQPSQEITGKVLLPQSIAGIVLLLIAIFHAGFVLDCKKVVDRGRAVSALTEQALRSGLLSPVDISFAPFGLWGWHLYPHYITHEGVFDKDPLGFRQLLRPRAIKLGYSEPNIFHLFSHSSLYDFPEDSSALIARGTYSFVWFFRADYYILRSPPEIAGHAAMKLRTDEYRFTPFPLNDDEWLKLIEQSPLSP